MPPKRRKLERPLGKLKYRKMFVIAVEGVKTEPQYFSIPIFQQSVIHIRCLKGSHNSSPPHVLMRMEEHIRKEGLKPSDEAWLVVDKDQWTDEQLDHLYAWEQKRKNYGFALSNPKFEYWLLLHFEDGTNIASSQNCSNRLERHLPGYDKGIDARKITRDKVNEAIRRAKMRDNPPCDDWPRKCGCTTVYRLVESIMKSQSESE